MRFFHSRYVLCLLLAASVCAPSLASTQTSKHKHKKQTVAKKKPDPVPNAAPPELPPPPPTPEHLPAVAPTVTYEKGLLTIVAKNSVLSDVLRAVRARTGANIDIPPTATERIVAQIGPGPARDVLAKLLNGTHFNYVMLGTAANPDAVAQIILTPSSGGPEPGPIQSAGGPAQPGQPQPYPNQPYPNQGMANPPYTPQGAQVQNPGDQGGGDGMTEGDNSQETVDTTPEENAPEQANGGEDGQQPNPNQPQVKTPEQLLQELQRQQQQQQQNQNQPGGQPQNQPQPQVVYPPQQYPQQPPQPQQQQPQQPQEEPK